MKGQGINCEERETFLTDVYSKFITSIVLFWGSNTGLSYE